jgi:hypothetical protein
MVLGRFKEAISDVAETIRRAFQAPNCHALSVQFATPGTATVMPLEAVSIEVAYRFLPVITSEDLVLKMIMKNEGMSFGVQLRSENAWTAWAAGAKVCEMEIFRVGSCGRLAIPALPRTPAIRRTDLPPFRPTTKWIREAIPVPSTRSVLPKVPFPKTRRDLDIVLGLPIAIGGEDFHKLPRALNMRYTFQLVKATGENIRNLDVLGVFPVPMKGVTSLQHDPRTGRILVNLSREAVGATRGRFILARRKDDNGFVSCFVEE